jgi:hypothetical protein
MGSRCSLHVVRRTDVKVVPLKRYSSMRNFNNIVIGLALACFCLPATGCSPDAVTEFGTHGRFSGEWDDQPWSGRGYAVLVSDTLFLFGHRRPVSNQFYDEEIWLAVPFVGVGRYEIHAMARLSKITGGDAGYFYSGSGELLLESVDLANQRLEGRLELVANGHDGPWRFENGVVNLPIYFTFGQAPPFY